MIGYSHPVLFVMDSDEDAHCVRADLQTNDISASELVRKREYEPA